MGVSKVLDFGLSRRTLAGDGVAQSPAAILDRRLSRWHADSHCAGGLRGEPLDPRVDLWALGVMLYEMTSGVLPFKRTTAFETAEAILHSIPDPLPPTVPVELRRITERCLAKDPHARFATAAELRAALDAVHVGLNRKAGRPSLRALAVGVATLLLVGAVGAL